MCVDSFSTPVQIPDPGESKEASEPSSRASLSATDLLERSPPSCEGVGLVRSFRVRSPEAGSAESLKI